MRIKTWINEFKLALIKEEVAVLEKLLDVFDLKNFVKQLSGSENFQEELKENLNEIAALLQGASVLISQKKTLQALEIQKFQKAFVYTKA
ncbi:hypothetical protein OQH60_03440 [Campylobacter sp. MIT 21-1685]|uniref:hypothetical protein n=1 Tax=unclassified Campylobacter TaxID=2593542 RepID=UPI00224ABE45|nr:hypothetical protein [Campylobacter sp. MIT 21-1684]MCX2751133.1 hypothetical protein [Campylobacter sp. MIT 21-1682]MCX2807400.1 hypothetical protein [Campylobacter sp. MIT 21-1685]